MRSKSTGALKNITTVCMVVGLLMPRSVQAQELYYLTCYCPESCPGKITYSGTAVREGIAAVNPEHIGDAAMLWTTEGEYLGVWECQDKLGTGHRGVIDIWKPDLASAKDMMALTKGKVYIEWIERPERRQRN